MLSLTIYLYLIRTLESIEKKVLLIIRELKLHIELTDLLFLTYSLSFK